MTINEIFDKVLVESGQFLIPDTVIELQVNKFKVLVDHCLGIYNTYVPIDMHLYKELNNGRQFTFTEENTPEGIPDSIADVHPVRISGVAPFFLTEYGRIGDELNVKKSFPWVYRKPVLTVPMNGEFDIHVIYHHKLKNTNLNNGGEPAWEIDSITPNNHEFFELLTGKFMQSLGRSRRAFTLNELPITVDGESLVSEGKTMEQEAMQYIIDNKHKFYLAWR